MKWWLFIVVLVVIAIAFVILMMRVQGQAQSTPTATPTPTGPAMCTITGNVVDASGGPFVNGTITINSQRIQVINGVAVNPTVVSTNTDANGMIRAVSMPQGLAAQITICPGTQQTANCSAPFSVIIPFSQTANFGNLAQGTELTAQGALQVTTLNVTGTINYPDGSTYTTAGHNTMAALGVGTAAPAAGQIAAAQLLLTNTSTALFFGSTTRPTASLSSWGMGALELGAGEHVGSGSPPHIADATAATIATHEPSGVMGFYADTGLTVGSPYTPTEIGWFSSGGLNLAHGTYSLNGTPVFQTGTFTPAIAGSGSNPTVTYTGQTGYWAQSGPIAYYFLRVSLSSISGGSGNLLFTYNGAPQCSAVGGSTAYAMGPAYGNGLALTSGYTQIMSQIGGGTYTVSAIEIQPNGTAPQGIPLSQAASYLDYLTNWTCRVY